jgi:hypothetical protein
MTQLGSTEYVYGGQRGQAYIIRVTAVDRANNAGSAEATALAETVRKYYAASGRRVAMREKGVVYPGLTRQPALAARPGGRLSALRPPGECCRIRGRGAHRPRGGRFFHVSRPDLRGSLALAARLGPAAQWADHLDRLIGAGMSGLGSRSRCSRTRTADIGAQVRAGSP